LTVHLDAVDWKILAELQRDGRMTNVELSRRVGISAPPCLRRVRSLEEDGIIQGYRALLEEKRLGYDLMSFAMVHLISQAETDLAAFQDKIDKWPLVRSAWMLSGDIDFLMLCVAPDLRTFQNFVLEITAAPNVRNVKTALTLKQAKNAPIVPLEATTPPRLPQAPQD
jgi:DNA-binding Lrp family transcriptional regulator